jgi:hypothetical protein
MTMLRDLLVRTLGGSEFMWDVALGVLIAFFVIGFVRFLLWIYSRIF